MYSKKNPQAPPISRGGACNNCKRRKMRCDGQRPLCGPCRKSPSLEDCEYADIGNTHADRLQEQISILETHLEKLQNAPTNLDARSNHLALYHPYPSNASTSSSSHNQRMENELMRAFLPYTSQFGFFLDARSLLNAFLNPMSDLIQRPTSALSASMILLGAHLTYHFTQRSNTGTSGLIESYLSQAVQATSLGLSESHPYRILHTIQANVLVAHYFFLHNRALQGRWHLDNAVSLVLSARLHQIRSSSVIFPNSLLAPETITTSLPAPRNVSEEGEQINAMWTVLALSCQWSAVEGVPSPIAYTTGQARVDTPWPLDNGGYSEVTLPPSFGSSHTLQNFLSGIPDEGNSILALYVKANVLFERTTVFWKQHSPPTTQETSTSTRDPRTPLESQEFQTSYQTLFTLLTRLLNTVPPIGDSRYHFQHDTKACLLIIHTLIRVAMIRLQCTLGADNPSYLPVFLDMANGIMECLAKVDLDSTLFLDPIMAVVLRGPAVVYIGAIKLLKSTTSYNAADVQKYSDNLDQLRYIMVRFSDVNPLMALEFVKLQADQQTEMQL